MNIHSIQFGAANHNVTDGSSVTITDNVSNIPNVICFLAISAQRQLNGSLSYPGGFFHVQYNRAPVILSDQGDVFSNSDTGGRFCVITSGGSTTFKNNGGDDTDANLFAFNLFHFTGV